MICQDGFITSHAVENMELLEDEEVKKFVGEYQPENYLLNPECPMAVGPYSITDYYMEAKRSQAEGMRHVEEVVLNVAEEFAGISGREYGLFEAYRMEDAEYAVVMIGSAAGTTKDAIDKLREQGEKVGLLKIRLYRPFPAEAIAQALKGVKAVAVMDRAEGYTNHGGPLGADVMAALYRITGSCCELYLWTRRARCARRGHGRYICNPETDSSRRRCRRDVSLSGNQRIRGDKR